MARQTRSDCTVGAFEKKYGLPPGTIRNKDGRDTRSDKKIGTIRREGEKKAESGKALTAQSPSGSPVVRGTSAKPIIPQAPDKLSGLDL